ncbi:MAG: hypothetical protein IJX81_03410 [Clostridia bacterium]|nr:hypothetical protein [Clostridia bacterium]
MRIYFLSCAPCALYVGGAYFGVVSDFERYAEIELSDALPVQFAPANALPVSFFLDESIRFSPPACCEVYLLEDGLALYVREFKPLDLTLRPITQKREGNLLVTVFSQGGVQTSVQTENGFFTAPLPPSFEKCEILFHSGCILFSSGEELVVFNQKGEKLFYERILSYEVEGDELSVLLPLSDLYKRTARCRYRLDENGLTQTEYSLSQAGLEDGAALLPYAFFESVRIGAAYESFLCEELREKAASIKEFLGNFLHVLPTDDENVCTLVYQKAPRLFTTRKFRVTLIGGAITDIQG